MSNWLLVSVLHFICLEVLLFNFLEERSICEQYNWIQLDYNLIHNCETETVYVLQISLLFFREKHINILFMLSNKISFKHVDFDFSVFSCSCLDCFGSFCVFSTNIFSFQGIKYWCFGRCLWIDSFSFGWYCGAQGKSWRNSGSLLRMTTSASDSCIWHVLVNIPDRKLTL